MAATALTVQQIVRSGLKPSLAAANADGNYFDNNGRVYLEVKNDDTASKTVTIQTPGTVDGLAIADLEVTVTAGESRKIGPFPTNIYNDANGRVNVSYSDVTSVTVGAFRL